MAKFRIDSIGGLARQMEFTPQDTRATQIANAEALLHSIDPAKAYPLDFVTFKITGYRPKRVSPDQLTGLALQHDLGLLIERVSQTLDVRTAALAEPVLAIDDVTEKFNVTSKTIQRWRRRGLPSRRFVFPDGKRRVGFLLSSVERFFSSRRDQLERGANFSQVERPELDEILRRARRLALSGRCDANDIARRIGRKLDRSPLTILHTIRKHDQEHPREAILRESCTPLRDEERGRILRLYRRGVALKKLASRAGRPRAEIYRIVIDERIAQLNKRKIRFIDDPLYHQRDAAAVMNLIAEPSEIGEARDAAEHRLPRDLPSPLASLCAASLLSPSRERALFLKFHFQKMQFVMARRRLEPQFARARDLNILEAHLRRATETKNEILRANLRLVVSVARRHLRPNLSLMELVSDGTLTLMRAIESFDIHRGNKFSTYATLALMKGFARSVSQMLAGRMRTVAAPAMLDDVPDRQVYTAADRFIAREELRHLLTRLDSRERDVLSAHYGLDESAPATYEQLGRQLGLSKQRVRQIEQIALTKLRSHDQ